MQSNVPARTARRDGSPSVFRYSFQELSYRSIAPARNDLRDFLAKHGMAEERAGALMLALSEILTNLIKHPDEKAHTVAFSVALENGAAALDVADDSTPFCDFDRRCAEALQPAAAHGILREHGYGLSCILQQHAQVSYAPMTKSTDGMNHFRVSDDAAPRPAPGKKKTVFIVDDDPIALKIEARMLEGIYTVHAFERPQDVPAAFEKILPDLVISDLTMPGMDGLSLRRELTGLAFGNETPFIFLSGNCESRDSPYINEAGIDDFVCKPVEKDHLLSIVARLIRRSEQVRSAVQGKMNADLSGALSPALPARWDSWKITVRTAAAEAGGGDFILHHETPEYMIAVLADVMGHGRMAKFFAYAYAGYLRSVFRMQEKDDAARLLDRLSAGIAGDAFLENIIMTCQSFQLYPDGLARIASAGHPAPLRIGPQSCAALDTSGPLPGLSTANSYAASEIRFAPGERMLFATDGFFQAFDRDKFRHEDLLPLLGDMTDLPLEDMAARTWGAFQENVKKKNGAEDDATFVLMEYGG